MPRCTRRSSTRSSSTGLWTPSTSFRSTRSWSTRCHPLHSTIRSNIRRSNSCIGSASRTKAPYRYSLPSRYHRCCYNSPRYTSRRTRRYSRSPASSRFRRNMRSSSRCSRNTSYGRMCRCTPRYTGCHCRCNNTWRSYTGSSRGPTRNTRRYTG